MAGTTQGIQKRLMDLGNEKVQELATELMQSEKFQQAFATAFGKAMAARQQVNKNMSTVLTALQVPTREDVDRLSRRVDKLHGQLQLVTEQLEALTAAQAKPRPKRKTASRPALKKKAARKSPRKSSGSE